MLFYGIVNQNLNTPPTQNYDQKISKSVAKRTGSFCRSPWASGDPVAIQCAWNSDPSVHWNATGEKYLVASVFPVRFQWPSSGFPICFHYANQRWIATGIPLGYIISQCGSSGIPVYWRLQWSSNVFQLYKLTLDHHWNITGCLHQLVWFQWHPNVLVAPVVVQCSLPSGIPVYWHNLVWRSLGQVNSQHATPYVYNSYGESCLS